MGLQVSVHLGRGTQCRQQGSRNTNREAGKASYMFKAALTPAWDNRANDRAMPGSLELCRLAPAGQPALGSCSSPGGHRLRELWRSPGARGKGGPALQRPGPTPGAAARPTVTEPCCTPRAELGAAWNPFL